MLTILRLTHEILDRRERVQLCVLGLAMLATGLAEMLGVGSVLPFMQIVADPTVLSGDGWLASAYERLGFSSPRSATLAAGVALLTIIAVNNAIKAAMTWAIASWGWGLNHRLSTTLLGRYVRQPYTFFLEQNTSVLNRTLLGEVASVVSGVIIPLVATSARVVGVLFIVGLLAWVDPVLALVLGFSFGGIYGVIYALLRKGQRRRGRERLEYNGDRFRIAAEVLTGIKDVKALGREEDFLRRFEDPSRRFARAAAQSQVAAHLPRYLLETIAMGTILAMMLASIREGTNVASVLPVLSLYGFGVYRLMPSLNAIFGGLISIRFNAPALEVLRAEIVDQGALDDGAVTGGRDGHSEPLAAVDDAPRIEVVGIDLSYKGSSRPALKQIDLRVGAGEVVGFVGRTGAGKTTLVDVILGLLEPSGGEVRVDGRRLDRNVLREWRTRCGYVPQNIFLADDTVAANIAFGIPSEDVDLDAVVRAARVAQIHEFVEGLEAGYDTVVGERGIRMSGGQRQRIGIARALYHDPDVLILDEATSALDGVTESAVLETIDALSGAKTVLVIAHRLTTVRACDVIHMMEGGEIVASGPYDTLIQEHREFRSMAGELAS